MAPSLGTVAIDLPRLGPADATVSPSALDVAYAAGFFDGEGHITIGFMSSKARTRGAIYTMRVGATQNDLAPLVWLRDRWGGSIRRLARTTTGGNPTFKWDLCSRMAASFLRDVSPLLLVKRRRADIALRFQDSLFIPGKAGHTAEYRERLEGLRCELAERNTHKPVKGQVGLTPIFAMP